MKLRSNYWQVWQKAARIQPYAAKIPLKFTKIRQKIQKQDNLASTQRLLPCGGVPLLSVLEWGDLRFNRATLEATYADRLLDLTAKESRLLEMFMHNGRRVLNQSEILELLWHKEETPSADTVKAHIKNLRQKLQAVGAPADLIETVYGLGYRLKAKPER